MFKIYDDFFNIEQQKNILNYCLEAPYIYGEVDTDDTPPTGFVHDIPKEEKINGLFRAKLKRIVPKGMVFYRMYINCFAPKEIPYFHTDGDNGITFLYYPQYDWNFNDGGETQLFVEDNIYGVVPISNRLLMFDANLLHRATTFRDRHRFTVAIKYEEEE